MNHDFYKTGDADAPERIKDRNGEVVLKMCRRCRLAESELTGVLECPSPLQLRVAAAICNARVAANPDGCGGGAIGYHAVGSPGLCPECMRDARAAVGDDPCGDSVVQEPRTRVIGERLECSKCGDVELWCQCVPSPFAPVILKILARAEDDL